MYVSSDSKPSDHCSYLYTGKCKYMNIKTKKSYLSQSHTKRTIKVKRFQLFLLYPCSIVDNCELFDQRNCNRLSLRNKIGIKYKYFNG